MRRIKAFFDSSQKWFAALAILLSVSTATYTTFFRADISKYSYHSVFSWENMEQFEPFVETELHRAGRMMNANTLIYWAFELPAEWGYRYLFAMYDPYDMMKNVKRKSSQKWFENFDRLEAGYIPKIVIVFGGHIPGLNTDELQLIPSNHLFTVKDRTKILSTPEGAELGNWDPELGSMVAYLRTAHGIKPFGMLAADFAPQTQEEAIRDVKAALDYMPAVADTIEKLAFQVNKNIRSLDYLLSSDAITKIK